MKFRTIILLLIFGEIYALYPRGKWGKYSNVFENTAKGALLKLLHGKLWTPRYFTHCSKT